MCSINGFTWRDDALIRRMNTVTAHRGPDGTGVFCNGSVSLGHNRLAIIDLSPAGAQPMFSSDGRYAIVFNGEIYNYRELREELRGGYRFRSSTDTEVILAAYAKWGTGAFARLNGMFALALWDAKEQKLVLARDPVGIKPLYYFASGERLVFASEVKAMFLHADIPRQIDPLAFALYLRVNYVPAPLTLCEGIKKLLPGHLLCWRAGAFSLTPFAGEQKAARSRLPRRALAEELRVRVRASVKQQLVSDRPVGLYLSGGIDSSAVLEGMARASKKVETFSVGFALREGEQEEKFNADFLLARETAKFFGAKHHEVLVSPEEIVPLLGEALYHLDEPVANPTVIPMLKLSRFAKERVAVALEGSGGDELFGGYERYRFSLISSQYRRLPASIRGCINLVFPEAGKLDTAPGIERFMRFHFLKDEVLRPLLREGTYHPRSARTFFAERFFPSAERKVPVFEDFERDFMKVDRQSWLPDDSLLRTDKLAMAAGLEARVPLLDLPLIALAETIPLRYTVSPFRTKILLKEAFRGFIPAQLLRQPKRGWFSPGAKWLRYPAVAAFAKEVLSPTYCGATKGLFNWDEVRRRLEAHIAGGYHLTELWAILTLQLWARRFRVTG